MAFSSVIRRASAAALPAARRAFMSSRSLRGGISAVLSAERLSLAEDIGGRSFVPFSGFSRSYADKKSSADKSLVQVLQSEIECAEEPQEVENTPDEFPFEIIDNPGERTILLKRNYQGENIEVEVYMPDYDAEGDDGEDQDDDSGAAPTISSVVRISKGKGEVLEFGVVISPDEFIIDSLSIKNPESSEDLLAYEGPDFGDLDENLQKSFLKYLEIRGIKSSIANFLVEYMTNKDNKEYLQWLQNLKSFVEK